MNNFYASVELLEHPELTNLPVAISGNPENRHGIILAKNKIAKKFGVLTAETIYQAVKKCPELVLLPPHHEKYTYFYHKTNEIYRRYTDLVEPFSIDESWLDLTASTKLFGTGEEIARDIQNTIRSELGLTVSAGVSFNKIFAKMGSSFKKEDGPFCIPAERFKSIIWELPISDLFGVGKITTNKMNSHGIYTIGDLANSDPQFISQTFGKYGEDLYKYSWGKDDSAVNPNPAPPKSLGAGITFKRDIIASNDINTAIRVLADKVSSRVRKHRLYAGGIKINIKYPTFAQVSKQSTLDKSTASSKEIFEVGINLLYKTWDKRTPIRSLTVTAIYLSKHKSDIQLSIFDDPKQEMLTNRKLEKIDNTLDEIRNKYGKSSISFASIVGNDIGLNELEFDKKIYENEYGSSDDDVDWEDENILF